MIPQDIAARMREIRHALHRQPEFGFEEQATARLIAETLRGFGLEVAEGIGGTGVVGSLTRGSSNRAIALRADMDALRITEATGLPHASQKPGLMHACGHDGHVAMLLGAAETLAREGGFDGTIRFLFQPAEEWGLGAQAMLDDGVLERFPFDEIYGIHNLPGLALDHVETRPGAIMSAEDIFEITLTGAGGHASRPDWGREVALPAAELVVALQAIVARRLDPTVSAVVSVTEISTDGARNILPGHARVAGDCRSFAPEVSAKIEAEMRRIMEGIALAHGITAELRYAREFIPTLNDPELTEQLMAALAPVSSKLVLRAQPMTGSEDFARFLTHVPGVFSFIGNGESSAPLHSPAYDFNDGALVHGAAVHVATARRRLPPA